MNLFNLKASLTLDKKDYEQGLDEAKKESDGFAQNVDKKLLPVTVNAWIEIGKKVLEVAQKIGQLAMQTMNYADNVGDLSAKFGVTTDSISEMQYIADQSSTSVEGLTSAMTMLLNRAKEDSDVFQRLGVSVKDANGNFKAMDELFYETVGAINSVEDANERNVLMLETFGRSAMSVGEVVRKSSDELARMRQEAHDLGVVMSEETIQYASDFNDTLAVMKLQGQSALASLVAGAPDAEERLQNFFDSVLELLENYAPAFVTFFVKLVLQVELALVRIAPSIVVNIFNAVLDTIFNINWFQVGVDIGKAVLEGFLNIFTSTLNFLFGWLGVDIPEVDLGVGESDYFAGIEGADNSYSVNNTTTNKIEVDISASGDTPTSEETAEKTAEALAPYIDRILGGK